jgi:mannitol/fructose-specific phosphotransferase system IIA component (Ntr-type)
MSGHEKLDLRSAAEHVSIDANELRHVAQRGEIEAFRRGDEWFFDHAALDEWAQRRLLASNARVLDEQHKAIMDKLRRERRGDVGVGALMRAEAVELALAAKAKAGAVRDMADLAVRTGLVYDPEALFKELLAREDAASTAVGSGAAFLHPRFHDPYLFEESFVAYGRSARPIYFGAPDGAPTHHFFLVCSTDHEQHLHILARLAVLAHGTDLLERLDVAEDADSALAAVAECESEYTA